MTDNIGIIIDVIEHSADPLNIGLIYEVPVVVTDPALGDVISYDGSIFRNRKQTELVDGGNF